MRSLFAALLSALLFLPLSLCMNNIDGLPLKTLVYNDASCSRANHLYYLGPNFCVGPLFEPASSIRMPSAIPPGCRLTAFEDARCSGPQVATYGSETAVIKGRVTRRQQQVIAGPSEPDTCFGIGEDPGNVSQKDTGVKRAGANSFFLSCEA